MAAAAAAQWRVNDDHRSLIGEARAHHRESISIEQMWRVQGKKNIAALECNAHENQNALQSPASALQCADRAASRAQQAA